MADQLTIYNSALLLCGERFLGSLTEEREPRRLLDQVWAEGGVNACLEEGQWNFAMRSIAIDYDPSIEPQFGYKRAFQKPTDWVLTSAVTEDEFFRVPLIRYWDEAGYWYAELNTIYVRYVSNDVGYGLNINSWPTSFYDFVSAHFASRIINKLSSSENDERLLKEERARRKTMAKNRCAMADPTKFAAQGSWSRSRERWLGRRDGGNQSGPLIG